VAEAETVVAGPPHEHAADIEQVMAGGVVSTTVSEHVVDAVWPVAAEVAV